MATKSLITAILSQAIAYAQKDIMQSLRFKVDFLATTFVPALINLGLFGTLFFGFFKTGAPGLAELNSQNFAAFTVLGALSSTLYTQAINSFQYKFLLEKYWQTVHGLLASPLSPWALLFGAMLSEAFRFSTVVTSFLLLAYIFWPPPLLSLLAVIILLGLLYITISGVSLIRSVLWLHNENWDPLITYFMMGTAYLACFYYPISFLPSFLQPLAAINPIYYFVYSVRSLWLQLPLEPSFLAVGFLLAVISPMIGTYLFQRLWRNLDITGY